MECRPWVGGGHWDCVTKASRYPVPCALEASARKPPQLLWLTAEYPGPYSTSIIAFRPPPHIFWPYLERVSKSLMSS